MIYIDCFEYFMKFTAAVLGMFSQSLWNYMFLVIRIKKIPSKSLPILFIWMTTCCIRCVFDVLYPVCFTTRFLQFPVLGVFWFTLLFCLIFYEIYSCCVRCVFLNLCEIVCFLTIRINIKPLQICTDSVNFHFFMIAVNAKLQYTNIDSIFCL